MADTIEKIYDIKTLGYNKVKQELEALNKQFEEIKRTKQFLNDQRAGIVDSNDLKKLIQLMNEQIAKEKEVAEAITQKTTQQKQAQKLTEEDAAAKVLLQEYNLVMIENARAASDMYQARMEASTAAKQAASDEKELNKLIEQEEKTNLAQKRREEAQAQREKAAADREYITTYKQLLDERDREAEQAKKNAVNAVARDSNVAMSRTLTDLRSGYDKLTKAERENAHIGGVLLARIKELDKELKGTDAATGRFQRNVGHYEKGFNAIGDSINQITRELPAFTNSFQTGFEAISNNLGPAIDAVKRFTEAQKAAKATAIEAANVHGMEAKETAILGGATEEAATEVGNLAKEQALAAAEGLKGTSAIKAIAKELFTWNTLLNVGIVLLTIYGPKILQWVITLIKGKEALDKTKESLRLLNSALESTDYKNAIQQVDQLRINIDLAKRGFIDKDSVVKQYNETIGKTTGQVNSLKQAEIELGKNADAYIKMTLYKAAANLALEDAAKKAYSAAQTRSKPTDDYSSVFDSPRVLNTDSITKGARTRDEALLRLAKARNAKLDNLRAQRREKEAKEAEADQAQFEKIAKDFQNQAAEISQKNHFDFFGNLGDSDSKAESEREKLRRRLEKLQEEIAAARNEVSKQEETVGYDEFAKMNTRQAKEISAVQNKYNHLLRLAKDFSKETKELTELEAREMNLLIDRQFAERSDTEYADSLKKVTSYWNKMRSITQQAFASGEIDQAEYNSRMRQIEEEEAAQLLLIADDYFEHSLKARQDYEALKTKSTEKGVQDRINLEKSEAEGRLAVLNKSLIDDEQAKKKGFGNQILYSTLGIKVSRKQKDDQKALEDVQYSQQKKAIQDSLLTVADKQKKIEELDAQHQANLVSIDDSYFKSLAGGVANGIAIFSQLYNQVAQMSLNRIDQEQQETQAANDKEKAIRESKATSTKEIAAIDKEYDQKKEKLEREAAKKKQAIAIKQALISIAQGIAMTFAELGWPAGIAGAAIVAATGALQIAAIKSQKFKDGGQLVSALSNIRKMAWGGSLQSVLSVGGVFSGQSHDQGGIPFAYRGQNIEVEGQEGYVINKKSMASSRKFTVTGTPSELASFANASNGGVNFAPGASMQMFAKGGIMTGGYTPSWFTNTAPPAFIQDYYTQKMSGSNNQAIDKLHNEVLALKDMMADTHQQLAEAIYTESKKQVVLDMNGANTAMKEREKAKKLGTL